jgi:hypothetical protein
MTFQAHPKDQAHPADHDPVIIEHDPHATLGPGPIDTPAWTAGAIGILMGLFVALCFALAASAVAG